MNTTYSGIVSQFSLRIGEIDSNSTSGITFDIIDELCHFDFLEGGVISTK
jgi:hypothetical protein